MLAAACCQFFQVDGVQVIASAVRDLFPHVSDSIAAVSATGCGIAEKGRLHSLHDFEEGNFQRGGFKKVSSGFSSLADDEVRPFQVIHDLDEKVGGHAFALRELFKACKSASVMPFGELNHRSACVIKLLGNFHGPTTA